MASRDPNTLDPVLKELWFTLQQRANTKSIDVILTCTFRSNDEQTKLYAQGRTNPGHIVTWAKAGQSKHNLFPARAFDVAIIRDGKCIWNTEDKAWIEVGKIGKELGLSWGGNWSSKKREFPHFELP